MKQLKPKQRKSIMWLWLAAFSWCAGPMANAAATADDTIVLKQKCTAIGGDHNVYLSKNSIRIENPNFVVFAKAPKWTATVINPTRKIYFQCDYKTALKCISLARAPFSVISDASSSKWRKVPGESIAGLSAIQWCNESSGKDRIKRSLRYWTAPEASFAPQCAEILATCYGIPSIAHGIPLRVLYTGTGNSLMPALSRHFDVEGMSQQEYKWLDTQTMKKVQVTGTLFSVPKGFKPTEKYEEVALRSEMRHPDASFILQDLRKHPEALFESR